MKLNGLWPRLENLEKFAISRGALKAKTIETSRLIIKESVKAKCFDPPCFFYGKNIKCPNNNVITPEIIDKIINELNYGIIIQLDTDVENFVGEGWEKRHRLIENRMSQLLLELRNKAISLGFFKTMAFGAGECLCMPGRCNIMINGICVHPSESFASMESCGFDVFGVMDSIGWDIVPIGGQSQVKNIRCASLVGLLLVE